MTTNPTPRALVPVTPTKALWCICSKCRHTWAAAYYPLDLAKMAKIAKRHSSCPKCGAKGLVARQSNGVLLEGDNG